MKYILIPIVALSLLFSSCATFQQLPQILGPPAQVQADITALGSRVVLRVSPEVKAQIHLFGQRLVAAADLNDAELVALIPRTGNAEADALINSAVTLVRYAIAKFGSHNQTTLSYFRAAGNGLLANF